MARKINLHIKKAYPYLVVLSETKNPQLKRLLLKNPIVLKVISELVLNLLKENIELSQKQKEQLKTYATHLIKLTHKREQAKKIKILSGQTGEGILSTLLSIGLPVLASMLFSNKNGSKD